MSAFCLIAGNAHPALGRRIAEMTGAALVPVALAAFADGESRVRFGWALARFLPRVAEIGQDRGEPRRAGRARGIRDQR